MLAKAKLASSITFIVLASFTIITYDRQNMFIIQATGRKCFLVKHSSLLLKFTKKSFIGLALRVFAIKLVSAVFNSIS